MSSNLDDLISKEREKTTAVSGQNTRQRTGIFSALGLSAVLLISYLLSDAERRMQITRQTRQTITNQDESLRNQTEASKYLIGQRFMELGRALYEFAAATPSKLEEIDTLKRIDYKLFRNFYEDELQKVSPNPDIQIYTDGKTNFQAIFICDFNKDGNLDVLYTIRGRNRIKYGEADKTFSKSEPLEGIYCEGDLGILLIDKLPQEVK